MNKLLIVTTISSTLRAFLLPFAHHFRALGWQVDGMAQGISDCKDCQQAFDRVWEVEWSRNPLAVRNLLVAPDRIRQIVDREQYDLVHVHTPVAAFVTRYALKDFRKNAKCKVIYTAHGFHFHPGGKPLKNTAFILLEQIAGKWTDYLVTINREDEIAAKQQLVPPEKVHYMPGIGVDLDDYHPQNISTTQIDRVRQELSIAPAERLFLSVAALIPRKRHQDLIRAFAQLDRPDVHLAIAGNGPCLEDLRQLGSKLGITERLHFLGKRNDIPTLIRAAVATILTSEHEGLPRSVMESLALEIPAIGTKIRGTQELIEGGCGLLVDVGEVAAIATAMAWILDNSADAQTMGKRGRERMHNYNLPQVIKLHESLYQTAMSH